MLEVLSRPTVDTVRHWSDMASGAFARGFQRGSEGTEVDVPPPPKVRLGISTYTREATHMVER